MALLAMLITASAQIKMKVTMNGPQQAVMEDGQTVSLNGTLILPYDAISSIEYFREPIKGLKMVDLGLPSGTLWANINFGANDSTEVGTQLVWADLGQISDIWGENWKAPSKEQMEELLDKCDWDPEKDSNGDFIGYRIYSQKNDNSIFLPATKGYRKSEDGQPLLPNRNFYWTSSCDSSDGYALYEDNSGNLKVDTRSGSHLLAVRPLWSDSTEPSPDPGPGPDPGPTDPTVTIVLSQTVAPTQTSVTYQLFFTDDYDKVSACGLYYVTSASELDISPRTVEADRMGQTANVTLTGLTAGTTYYVKAFAKVAGLANLVYSDVTWFTTAEEEVGPVDPNDNYPKAGYVDLGTSVKWAKWNMGARSVADYGYLFGWGVLDETKTENNDLLYGTGTDINSSIAGNETYDVATAKWGEGWSTPTRAQFNELKDKCTWQYVQSYNGSGITGYVVTGKGSYSGNSIFLPLAGLREFGEVSMINEKGYYWSSENTNARNAYRGMISLGAINFEAARRYTGCSIRPVYSGKGDEEQQNPNDESLKGYVNAKGAFVPNEGVDMGIKNQTVKWAQWNVGATGYGSTGDYYSWGDTETKSSYGDSDYTQEYKGIIGSSIGALDDEHDVARQQWGRKWRMPTWAEFKALLLNAQNKEWVTGPNGTHGLRVTNNGKSLYFPAAGFITGTEPSMPNSRGCYWSKTPYNDLERSYYLNFIKNDNGVTADTPQFPRSYGLLIRPVWDDSLTGQ